MIKKKALSGKAAVPFPNFDGYGRRDDVAVFHYSYERMRAELEELRNLAGGCLRVQCAGTSADGREIPEVLLGEEQAPVQLLLHGGMHGREYLNTALLLWQIKDYLQQEGGLWKDQACFHIIPMVNPDGCSISQYGPDEIRSPELRLRVRDIYEQAQAQGCGQPPDKYFREWKANARGVDINRNFDAGWQQYAGPKAPCAQGFKGWQPGGEPETRAILEISRRHPLDGCISYHSSGNLIYWEHAGAEAFYRENEEFARRLGESTGYRLVSVRESGEAAAGCSDYFVGRCRVLAVTMETGAGNCPLDAEEFPEICRRNRGVWQAAAQVCLEIKKRERNS